MAKRTRKKPAAEIPAEPTDPTPLAEPLDSLAEKLGLTRASELPAQLPPPELELLPLKREVIDAPVSPPAERPRPEDDTQIASEPETNGKLHHEPELERLPRKREGFTSYVSVANGHSVSEATRVIVSTPNPISEEHQAMLADAGFKPSEDIQEWTAPANHANRVSADRISREMDGRPLSYYAGMR